MRIDAHQHYWKIDRGDYGWITPEITELYKDFLPSDLIPHLQKHHINRTILVQAAPTIAETEFLLNLSNESATILGVIGWIDLDRSDYRSQYSQFEKHPKFLGFRLMIQDMPDENVILKDNYIEALRYFAEKDVPIDLLFTHDQFPAVIQLLEKVPTIRGVIDHIGKPNIAEEELDSWRDDISKVAKNNNIYCKLSGMVTEANHHQWKVDEFIPYIQHVLTEFGMERVMFGSDWPVCLLAGSYDDVVNIVEQALPANITESEKKKLFGGNAKSFYKI